MTDQFFVELKRALRGLPEARIQEIVDELEAHVAERERFLGRPTAIASLGDPGDIGRLYLATEPRPAAAHGPLTRSLLALERLGGLALRGVSTAAGALLGISAGLFLIGLAVMKPFSGDRVGVWLVEDQDFHVSLGRSAVAPGQEMLGWWLVPVGLIVGAALVYLTGRWSLSSVRRLSQGASRIGEG